MVFSNGKDGPAVVGELRASKAMIVWRIGMLFNGKNEGRYEDTEAFVDGFVFVLCSRE